jgi:hypothetical protein
MPSHAHATSASDNVPPMPPCPGRLSGLPRWRWPRRAGVKLGKVGNLWGSSGLGDMGNRGKGGRGRGRWFRHPAAMPNP